MRAIGRLGVALLILGTPNAPLMAQQAQLGHTGWELTLGLTDYQIRDQVLNNVRHRGAFPGLAFAYQRASAKARTVLEIRLTSSLVKSRYDPDRSSVIVDPSLTYTHTRAVAALAQNTRLLVGGNVGFESHVAFYDSWDESHLYWLTAYSLGPTAAVRHRRRGGDELDLMVRSPILALVSRPPERFLYKAFKPDVTWAIGKMHERSQLTSVHEHRAVDAIVSYTFTRSVGVEPRLSWRVGYINNTMPYSRNVRILTHTLGLTFLF